MVGDQCQVKKSLHWAKKDFLHPTISQLPTNKNIEFLKWKIMQ